MQYFTLFLFLCIVSFTSCDGRDRANKSNTENLVESKLSDSFFEIIKYFPETYSEVVTDTILSNGYNVKLKFYSNMNNYVLNDFKIDTIHYKHYYREFKGDLKIIINGKTIFNKTIDKSYFTEDLNETFWQNSIMGNMSLDESQTTNKHLFFNVFFCIPESEICKDYNIIIDTKGESKIEELESEIY